MKLSRMTMVAAAVAVLSGGVAIWSASAQPSDPSQPSVQPTTPTTPTPGGEGRRPGRPGGPGAGDRPGRSEWADKLKDELQDHPRMARALVAIHDARDYMEKAPNDFGGHKASSIKACDDAIKELTEAMKFDAKRGDKKGGAPGDTAPATTPATPPKP